MKKLKFMGILLTGLFLLSACEDGGHFLFNDSHEYEYNETQTVDHPVFFNSAPMQLAMYEPAHGSFIGLYTDFLPGSDGRVIASVETIIGVRHAAFMEVMRLGDELPTLWLLECIAEQKLPVIVILPPEDGDPFGGHWEDILISAAEAFSEFPVPMLAVFYPLPLNGGNQPVSADTYIAFFRYARALFAIHAPHVAFVWMVEGSQENFIDYFPGNQAVDWVGLSLFYDRDVDFLPKLTEFYLTFQREKPIMLNLGLSHFSITDHRYRITETAAALEFVYQTILTDFPRVKMVNYMDISRKDYNGHDYRISIDPALSAAYRLNVSDFISALPRDYYDGFIVQPIRSAYTALVEEGRIYLDMRFLRNELGISTGRLDREARWIGGARRIEAGDAGIIAELRFGSVWISLV